MRINNSLVFSQQQFCDDEPEYNFRCCICKKLSGYLENEVCDLVSEDQVVSVWELFDNDLEGMGEHFVVAGDFLFFRHLTDRYFGLTCEGPQFGASLRKIVEQFSIKDIYIQGGTHIEIDAFREILQRRDITLNELRSLASFHESQRMKSFFTFVGSLLDYAGTHLGTILTVSAIACSYIYRKTKRGWMIAITTVALHVLRYLEDALSGYDVMSCFRVPVALIQTNTPSIVKTAFRLFLGFSASVGSIVLPALMAVVIYQASKDLAGRLSPVASVCLDFTLETADLYPRSTIMTLLVVSALFAEIALEKLREEDERNRRQEAMDLLLLG